MPYEAVCVTTLGTFTLELFMDEVRPPAPRRPQAPGSALTAKPLPPPPPPARTFPRPCPVAAARPPQMPVTVSNFVDLANNGFYNGLSFHRVIPNFMAQFGCPYSREPTSRRAGTGGPDGNTTYVNLKTQDTITRDRGGNIPDELTQQISNTPGTISMANTGRPNSGGSQFFINVADNSFLDWFNSRSPSAHPVFGKVKTDDDLAIIQSIVSVDTTEDRPNSPVIMESITIVEV